MLWTVNSKNETAFVERRLAGSTGAWTTRATVKAVQLDVVPGVGGAAAAGTWSRSYVDQLGNDRRNYEYRVHAVNTVGDVWDYSNPPGGILLKAA